MRLAYYAGVSTAAAAACLLKAFHERPNFYSASVYLSQSNACLLIITNLILMASCSFMYGVQRLLYGPLRPIEIEQLSEKAWYAVLDTLLAMPSFREDVGGWLLAMFTLLLAGKVWGWIGEGKVDVLEQQPPANPRLFHARLATSLVVSMLFDIWMLDYCIETVLADPRPGMMVIFAFEFAVLSICSIFTFARYLLCVVQIRIEKLQTKAAILERVKEIAAERASERRRRVEAGEVTPESLPAEEIIDVDENEVDIPGWEEKRRYLFALEVFTDFIKLLIYIVFFTVSITFNGLPMHIMRDVYMTFASFTKRVSNYVAYRKATSDMNTRYPDATTEQIRGDACIVCRESMVAWETTPAPADAGQLTQAHPAPEQPAQAAPPQAPDRKKDEGLRAKRLPCGHILHLRCLKAWLERQQVCPTCRSPVVANPQTAAAPGAQGGAGGGANANANANAPGQQPAQPAAPGQPAPNRRENRARILNLGPLRIGFLNGPGDQIANLIRQMNNGAGAAPPAAADAAAPDANQQGPNHLGLQVPYLPAGSERNLSDPGASTQTQLQQIEQRLMQEAQSLNFQQQQLVILRMMEQELARLRMLQASTAGSAVPFPQRPPQPPSLFPNMQMRGYMPPAMPFQPNQTPFQTALHGNTSQQYSNGHESLPPGMTIPEGWTVMPLHRAGSPAVPQPGLQTTPPPPAVTGSETILPDDTSADANLADANVEPAVGPTDDTGSPLFVPTAATAADDSPATAIVEAPTLRPSTTESQPPPIPSENTSQPVTVASSSDFLEASQSAASEQQRAPWTSSEGWSFVDPPNGQSEGAAEADTTAVSEPATGALPEVVDTQESTGPGLFKGKGKAAAIEDVEDEGT